MKRTIVMLIIVLISMAGSTEGAVVTSFKELGDFWFVQDLHMNSGDNIPKGLEPSTFGSTDRNYLYKCLIEKGLHCVF